MKPRGDNVVSAVATQGATLPLAGWERRAAIGSSVGAKLSFEPATKSASIPTAYSTATTLTLSWIHTRHHVSLLPLFRAP